MKGNRRDFVEFKIAIVSLVFSICTLASSQEAKVFFHVRGEAVSDVLIIVKSLDTYRESFRELTDTNGFVPGHSLTPGLYRAILTCPYGGTCRTTMQEFLVSSSTERIDLDVHGSPSTRGWGDSSRKIRFASASIKVLNDQGNPIKGARVLVRDEDEDLMYEKWYLTDSEGKCDVQIPEEEDVVVVAATDKNVSSISFDATVVSTSHPLNSSKGFPTISLRFQR